VAEDFTEEVRGNAIQMLIRPSHDCDGKVVWISREAEFNPLSPPLQQDAEIFGA